MVLPGLQAVPGLAEPGAVPRGPCPPHGRRGEGDPPQAGGGEGGPAPQDLRGAEAAGGAETGAGASHDHEAAGVCREEQGQAAVRGHG